MMALPARYLATKLTESLPTTDGGVLRTIGDAVTHMTALPKHRELKNAWQQAAKRAGRGGDAAIEPRAVHERQARPEPVIETRSRQRRAHNRCRRMTLPRTRSVRSAQALRVATRDTTDGDN